MKRLTFSIIVCLAFVTSQAQEHLRFMGIPISGTVEEYANRLVAEKGLEFIDWYDYEEPDFKMETISLIGNFEMFEECVFVVRKIERADETSSVIVYIDSLKCMNGEFDQLNALYDKRYGEYSGYWGYNKWESRGGRILAGSVEGGYCVVYMNNVEVEIREALLDTKQKAFADSLANHYMDVIKEEQTVKEICGIPFGSSYEKTKEMLENKYGYPEYSTDRNVITYNNKTYAGFTFDSIHFLFQSDGIHSYLNGCVFIMDAKSLSEAKKMQEMLYKKLSDKYIMVDNTDSNGNKYYMGGYSPVQNDGLGFSIEILKYNSDIARFHCPYAVRLAYGRYNYVKEEF